MKNIYDKLNYAKDKDVLSQIKKEILVYITN